MLAYAEITEADAFFAGRSDAAHWQSLTDEVKQTALKQATQLLDSAFDWKGVPATENQPLRWPRKDVFDLDSLPVDPETVPARIKIAVMEQALFMTDPLRKFSDSGIKNASAGAMSLSMDLSRNKDLISPAAVTAVRGFGTLRISGKSGAKCGSILRG